MKLLLAVASAAEALTGVLLLALPAVVVKLLFARQIEGAGFDLSRVAGIALVSLAIACWPVREPRSAAAAAMLAYQMLILIFLATRAIIGETNGPLLWPAAAYHGVVTALLTIAWLIGTVRRDAPGADRVTDTPDSWPQTQPRSANR